MSKRKPHNISAFLLPDWMNRKPQAVAEKETYVDLEMGPAPLTQAQKAGDQKQSCEVIVITSGKGGVGKTTATANIGMCIARMGYRIALVDADIGLRNLDLLLGLENRVVYTAMEVMEGTCTLDQALVKDKRWKNLSMLAMSKNRQRYNITRSNMLMIIDALKERGFQYILIDCPAGVDIGFANAIAPANQAVVVTTPEITSMRDADRVIGIIEQTDNIKKVSVLVNRVRIDMIKTNDMMSVQDVVALLGLPLVGAIPEDPNVIISTNRGEPLVLQKNLTLAGVALEDAARTLIGFPGPSTQKGWGNVR